MKLMKSLLLVIITLGLIISCSSIPKPSEKFDGIIVIDAVRTGVVNLPLGNSVIRVIDENSLQVIESVFMKNNRQVIIRLPEGVYRLKAAYSHMGGKDDGSVAMLNESIVIERGTIKYIDHYVEFRFKKYGTDGFIPSTFWHPIQDEQMAKNIQELEENKNIELWNLVY